MKTLIVAKQLTIRDDLRGVIEKKLSKFDKFFDDSAEACVTLARKRGRESLELTITVGSTLFRAEEEDETFQSALDSAVDTIEGQIRKNKTRLQKRLRSGHFDEGTYDLQYSEDDDAPYKIRVKSFVFRPMSPEEAILQMNLLGHEFFIFIDDVTGKTNVIYKRKDKEYGLIVPEN